MDRKSTISRQSNAHLDSDWHWEVIGKVLFTEVPQADKDKKRISHWCQAEICTEIGDRIKHSCSESTLKISVISNILHLLQWRISFAVHPPTFFLLCNLTWIPLALSFFLPHFAECPQLSHMAMQSVAELLLILSSRFAISLYSY